METDDTSNATDAVDRARGGVQSVEVAGRVLMALADGAATRPLKDIAATAGISASKAHRYLVSLMRAGLVEQDGATGRYDLGGGALRLGLAALGRVDVVRLATPALMDLRDAVEETVALAIWGDFGPTIVRWEEPARPVTVNVRPGSVLSLTRSATGRVFLAWTPDARLAPLLQRDGLAPDTPEVAALRAETRACGLGHVVGDLLPGIAALAAPVFDHQGQLVAALVALGHQQTFDGRTDGPLAERLRTTVTMLSDRLGWPGAG